MVVAPVAICGGWKSVCNVSSRPGHTRGVATHRSRCADLDHARPQGRFLHGELQLFRRIFLIRLGFLVGQHWNRQSLLGFLSFPKPVPWSEEVPEFRLL